MNEAQKKAIEDNLEDLADILHQNLSTFLDCLEFKKVITSCERGIIEKRQTTSGKVIVLLRTLQYKNGGWDAIIKYLIGNNFSQSLVEKLRTSGEETSFSYSTEPIRDFINDFKLKLAGYYKSQYSRVPTVFGHKPIQNVWVPLQIEENTESPKQRCELDHLEPLRRLASVDSPHVALVKGQPGVGKTTLVKKIAYDWATNLEKEAKDKEPVMNQFSLVLTVPLRYVGKMADFLHMTADYYANRLDLSKEERSELPYHLKQLGSKLLICLDGLDEYGSFLDSPFNDLFAAPFPEAPNKFIRAATESPFLSYQLLITSRPYACDMQSRKFLPLKFVISLLNNDHLESFVQMYCDTEEGRKKVSEYLKDNANLVIKVPLILTFVCCLADVREEIPTNLTLLYQKLLNLMLKTELENGKIKEQVEIKDWEHSQLVKSTAQLAFEGCKSQKLEFSQSVQNAFDITSDSFTSGFLLRKFNFREMSFDAEFPHKTFQEFFAALHLCHLISTTDNTKLDGERQWAMTQIVPKSDSLFGRFFFGLCSVKTLTWLDLRFTHAEMVSFDLNAFLLNISSLVSDCAPDCTNMIGNMIASSLHQLAPVITTIGGRKISDNLITKLLPYDQPFMCALHLHYSDATEPNWYIPYHENPKWSRLTFVSGPQLTNLNQKLGRTNILWWQWDNIEYSELVGSLERLTPVTTLVLRMKKVSAWQYFEVNIQVNYVQKNGLTDSPDDELMVLRHFTFGFDRSRIINLLGALATERSGAITLQPLKPKSNVSWTTVTVNQWLEQHKLVKILIVEAAKMCDVIGFR